MSSRQRFRVLKDHDFVDEIEGDRLFAEVVHRNDALKMQLIEHLPCADEDIATDHRSDRDLGNDEERNVEAIAPHAERRELAGRRAMQFLNYAGRKDVDASAGVEDYVRWNCPQRRGDGDHTVGAYGKGNLGGPTGSGERRLDDQKDDESD